MNKKYDIITVLDICVDFIVSDDDINPEFGQKEKLVNDYKIELGGSTCIFACQAAKLGLRIAGVGVVGNDSFGDLMVDTMKEAGVDTSYIEVNDSVKTSVSIHLCKKDDRAILTYSETVDAEGFEKKLLPLIDGARHLHIGSYFLMEKLMPHYSQLIKIAKKAGMTVSLDTNWDPNENWTKGLAEILPMIDIFFPNISELVAISGQEDYEKAAEILCNDVSMLVLKKGEYGSALYQLGKPVINQVAIKVNVVDAIGAGDSFDAGFLYGYLNGWDKRKCLEIANYCGAKNTLKTGGTAGQPWEDEIKKIL